jgi:hypothetical protein
MHLLAYDARLFALALRHSWRRVADKVFLLLLDIHSTHRSLILLPAIKPPVLLVPNCPDSLVLAFRLHFYCPPTTTNSPCRTISLQLLVLAAPRRFYYSMDRTARA